MDCSRTHRPPSYAWKYEKETDCDHQENQNNGEQVGTKDERGSL